MRSGIQRLKRCLLVQHGRSTAAASHDDSHAAASGAAAAAATARAASSLSSVIASEQGKTRLQGYLPNGFILNNTQVEGPILCLPELWLMWDVRRLRDVSMESLAVMDLMTPPPEVLVVGCGARMRRLPQALMQQLADRRVAVEVLDTRNALAYFNFLNDEGRVVVGALLPSNEDSSDDGLELGPQQQQQQQQQEGQRQQ